MSTQRIPDRSLDQRRAALERANEVRHARARRKALWKNSLQAEALADLADLVEDTPAWAAGWRVEEALYAVPRFGRAVVQRLVVRRIGAGPKTTIGTLTDRQRLLLHRWLVILQAPYPMRNACPSCGGPRYARAERCRRCRRGAA